FKHAHPNEHFDLDKLSEIDFAFLATVPAAVAFLMLAIGDLFSRRDLLRKIGFRLEGLPAGVIKGVIAAVIVLPVMFFAGAVLEMIYNATHLEHPSAHELLTAMKGADPWVKRTLILGACVAAPVFEEFLFRGHIQTLLVRLFNDRRRPRTPPPPFPPPFAGTSSAPPGVFTPTEPPPLP